MRIAATVGIALLVAGCVTPENQAKIDGAVSASFAVSCSLVDVAWLGWKAYEAKHPLPESKRAKVAGAYAAAVAVCNEPPVNTPELLSAAVKAANAFDQAIRDAKNG